MGFTPKGLLSRAASPHPGFLNLGQSLGLQGGWPTLLKGPWAPQMNSGDLVEPVVQTNPRHVLCPVQYWPDAEADCLVTEPQTDSLSGP